MPPRRSSDATKSSQTPEAEKSDMHETFAAYFKPQEIATQILVEVKKAETRVFDEEGGIQQSFVENIAGKNGSRVYLTEKFPEDYPQERVERVMSTQQTAKDAYKMLSKHDTGLLKKIIPPGEKILAQMSTVGFVGFPTTDEELSGPGMIIITDKQLYLYWSCSRYEASAFDHITGSTFCCCPRGFCGCFKCCRYYSGAYSHVGVREAEEKIAFIPTSQITPGGVRSERADRLVIERRAIFGNEDGEEFSCAECCCKIVCFPCIYCPCPSCACCFYHGQMVFSFSSDSSKSLIQNKIMTNIKNKSRDEQIYDGRLRVLTLRYVDLACNKVKHISCIVDKDQVAAEDLHKFCAAVNSTCKAEEYLKNFQQTSSMSFTDNYRSQSLRNTIMRSGRSGGLGGGDFKMRDCCKCCNPCELLRACCRSSCECPSKSIAMVKRLREDVHGQSSGKVQILPPTQISNSMQEDS